MHPWPLRDTNRRPNRMGSSDTLSPPGNVSAKHPRERTRLLPRSTTGGLLLGCCLWLAACTPSAPVAPQLEPDRAAPLWMHLRVFKEADSDHLRLEYLQENFGEAHEIDRDRSIDAGRLTIDQAKFHEAFERYPKDHYYRFTEAQQQAGDLTVHEHRYFYLGRPERYVALLVDPETDAILGWEWHEDVPPEKTYGPPRPTPNWGQ